MQDAARIALEAALGEEKDAVNECNEVAEEVVMPTLKAFQQIAAIPGKMPNRWSWLLWDWVLS